MKLSKNELTALVNDLERIGSSVVYDVLKVMDSDNLYHTTQLAKQVQRTWRTTNTALRKLVEMGIVTTERFYEIAMYNKGKRYLNNAVGHSLTLSGSVLKRFLHEIRGGNV